MLYSSPPVYGSWSGMLQPIKEGVTGWPAFALQRAVGATPDGAFGPKTKAALVTWQKANGLVSDGVAGPATQNKILDKLGSEIASEFPGLDSRVLPGFANKEGANILAATNSYTPQGSQPGVDCGPVQWRQYGPPFTISGLKSAFDTRLAFRYAADILIKRMNDYKQRRPTLSTGRRLELAVLAHNAPFLSEQVVRNGRLTTPNAEAGWTKKPGGGHYTHAEWSIVYPAGILAG